MLGADSSQAIASRPSAFPAYKCRTARRRNPETPAASGCSFPILPVLRPSESPRPPPAARAQGNCSPARHSCAPNTTRIRLRRSLLLFRSGAGLRAAHPAAASSAALATARALAVHSEADRGRLGPALAHTAAASATVSLRGELRKQILRQQRNRVESHAGRIANRIQDRRRRPIVRQFADALRAISAVTERNLLEDTHESAEHPRPSA